MPTDQILATEEMVGSGHATKADTLNRFLNKLTTAGDTLYASAAQTVARLAIGAANTKKFVNAAGTGYEWAIGLKIGVFNKDTSDATGTQAITGVGFKPSHIIFLVIIDGTPQVCIGFDDGTLHYSIRNDHNVSATTWAVGSANSIILSQGVGILYAGAVSVLGADGFTISWVKTGAKTGTANIHYMAFR